LAKIGVEYIETFAHARAAGYDAIDLDSPYYIGEWFTAHLEHAGHDIRFTRRNQSVGEKDVRDTALGGDDARWVDEVDLCLLMTHGTYDDHRAILLFDVERDSWEGNSKKWHLGDTCNLEWLFIFGCHSVDRDHLLDLLGVFRGLHLYCGAYSWMYDSWTIQEAGQDTADHLIAGKPVADAWLEGTSDWWVENHPTVVSVERREQYVGGDADWPNTVLCTDRLWGHGTTRADVLPPDQFMMICKWSDRGVWDFG
jgi:hypothetical protein